MDRRYMAQGWRQAGEDGTPGTSVRQAARKKWLRMVRLGERGNLGRIARDPDQSLRRFEADSCARSAPGEIGAPGSQAAGDPGCVGEDGIACSRSSLPRALAGGPRAEPRGAGPAARSESGVRVPASGQYSLSGV